MDFEQITTEVADRVLTITLNRPDRLNAWTATMGRELIEAFDRADGDDEVGAIIVTGAGRGYCAGADLAAGGETFDWRAREATGSVPRDNGGQFTLRVFSCLKPVIAAINGPAVGVGATMTLPMDVRLAADDARMGFVFARRGIVPEACSSWFLPRVVGISRDGVGGDGSRLLRAGGAAGGPGPLPAPGRRAARRRQCPRPRDRR
jgi:enoyl-CoA hydratase/carnithine racemase